MILKCDCKSDYQDKKHGKNMRVKNPLKCGQAEPQTWRCTVCEKVQPGPRKEN